MKTAIGLATTFVAGFAVCALVLQLAQRHPLSLGGSSLPTGRHALAQALGETPRRSGAASLAGLPSIADAVARVAPAVVNIEIQGRQTVRGRGMFGSFLPHEQPFEGSGSGVILSADGYVLTNNHVVAPLAGQTEQQLTVTLASGAHYSVVVVGRDPASDLAVIKLLGAKNLTPAQLADSESVRVGDWAIAVGNPLGFNSTVTLGIVSALNRRYPRHDSVALEKILQTDAAINPGSSGGALADIEGRVIGINTAIATTSGTSVGIGFAIPINAARKIASQLIEKGRVTRPYLGVVFAPLAEIDRTALPAGVTLPPEDQGVVVHSGNGGSAVFWGSPAQKAGLQEWDVLLSADGRPLLDDKTLRTIISEHQVGEPLRLHLWRAGREQELTAVLEEMPEGFGEQASP